MTNNKLNSIGTQSIPRLILAFSVPAIVSMAVESLYNVIDRYFVAAGVGYLGIAGITLCFPIMLFIMALSMIVGVGGNTLFAIRLGQKKYGQAALILNNSFTLLIVMALISFVLGEIFMEPLLKIFGASEETLPYATNYMRIILIGAVFVGFTEEKSTLQNKALFNILTNISRIGVNTAQRASSVTTTAVQTCLLPLIVMT